MNLIFSEKVRYHRPWMLRKWKTLWQCPINMPAFLRHGSSRRIWHSSLYHKSPYGYIWPDLNIIIILKKFEYNRSVEGIEFKNFAQKGPRRTGYKLIHFAVKLNLTDGCFVFRFILDSCHFYPYVIY